MTGHRLRTDQFGIRIDIEPQAETQRGTEYAVTRVRLSGPWVAPPQVSPSDFLLVLWHLFQRASIEIVPVGADVDDDD